MDAEKLIQVSLQIPAGALDSLSRLAEQLRLLTEAANIRPASAGRAAGTEQLENPSFDPARFQALRQEAFPADEPAEAALVSPVLREKIPEAVSAGEALAEAPADTVPAGVPEISRSAGPEERAEPAPPAEEAPALAAEIPAVQARAEQPIPDAPEVQSEMTQQPAEVESARVQAVEQALVLAAVAGEVSGGIETPLGAGAVVHTGPELPRSRWSGVTEELVIPGPAPLTAEAVSLAFQRDGRRYDNGFPLY